MNLHAAVTASAAEEAAQEAAATATPHVQGEGIGPHMALPPLAYSARGSRHEHAMQASLPVGVPGVNVVNGTNGVNSQPCKKIRQTTT